MPILSDISLLDSTSKAVIRVLCDLKFDNCIQNFEIEYHKLIINEGIVACGNCIDVSHLELNSLPEYFLDEIDTEQKAYLLGFIASNAVLEKKEFVFLKIKSENIKQFVDIINSVENITMPQFTSENILYVKLKSIGIVKSICRHLSIDSKRKYNLIGIPLLKENLIWHFIRGYFDDNGYIPGNGTRLEVTLSSNSKRMLEGIANISKIPNYFSKNDTIMCYSGTNALDFLGKMYANSKTRLDYNYFLYIFWCTHIPAIQEIRNFLPHCLISRSTKDAIIPSKTRISDVGYDLTIISEIEKFGKYTTLYDTGIKATPETGWYISVVPRSSLSKSGYIMTNSIGIVDPSYLGTIRIALTKIDIDKPDIKLPSRVAQMIFNPIVNFEIEEVPETLLIPTERGSRGYGDGSNGNMIIKEELKQDEKNNIYFEMLDESMILNGKHKDCSLKRKTYDTDFESVKKTKS